MPRRGTLRAGRVAPARLAAARFRDDLVIRTFEDADKIKTYQVEDPVTRECFSFGEEEFFLCQSMDGTATAEEILSAFQARFGMEMTPEHLRSFEAHLLTVGIAQPSVPGESGAPETAGVKNREEKKSDNTTDPNPKWKLFNPEQAFNRLLKITLPFRPLVILSIFALIPLFPLALFVIFRHSSGFLIELATLSAKLGYIGGLLFSLLAANLVRCIIQGIVCAYYKLSPSDFGFKLRRGILPRFYIEKRRVRGQDRKTKLWIYGTSILVRIYFVVVGVGIWALFKDSPTLIPALAVTMAQAGLIGLVLELLPLETTDGYRWLVNFFNWPPNMILLAFQVLYCRVTRRGVPDTLKGWRGWRYTVYAVILIVVLTLGSIKIVEQLAAGLTQSFPNIFGRATQYILIVAIGYFVFRWAAGKFMHQKGKKTSRGDDDDEDDFGDIDGLGPLPDDDPGGVSDFFSRHKGLLIVLAIILVMFIPFAYRPGGEIQVLPPLQQQIQAPGSGKIAEVYFEGGDGKLISRGAVVAKMISSEIENDLLTLDQSRSQQAATLDKAKSELAKLQSGARIEEITAAQAKFEQATEQMSVASQEWESAKVSSAYSSMVLPRLQQLYKSGSLALLQYEEAKKSADIDKINVEKASKNLSSITKARDEAKAQLDLLKSGARPEDIDSARHTVEAAQADLSRIDQQIQYARQQQTESALLMPFDGYLVDSHLDFKKGAYLWKGSIYATAQNNSQPLVELQLPEYDMEGVEVGAAAQVKLFAYPNFSLNGKVLSIQPAASTTTTASSAETVARMFRVLIEVDKPPFSLKAGMTGYAKIDAGYQPLGMLLARPLVRFVQIEMWSWLP